jgi:hypothetical protein
MESHHIASLIFFCFVVLVASSTVRWIVATVLKTRAQTRELEQVRAHGSLETTILETQRTVEAMSIEIERIGESQRYLLKQLQARNPEIAPRSTDYRVTTPS